MDLNRKYMGHDSVEKVINHRSSEIIELIDDWKRKAVSLGYSDVELDIDYDVVNFWAVK